MSDSLAHRLGILESQINFLMQNMRMRAMIQTGLIDPATGQPAVKIIEGTLFDHWKLHEANTVPPDPPADPPSDVPLPPADMN